MSVSSEDSFEMEMDPLFSDGEEAGDADGSEDEMDINPFWSSDEDEGKNLSIKKISCGQHRCLEKEFALELGS